MKKIKYLYFYLFMCFTLNNLFAQNIQIEPYKAGFDQPVGIVFDSDGNGYVWEKAGIVKKIAPNGGDVTQILDISAEVMNIEDHGLLGFALDPNFGTNGYIYLWYAVEPRTLFQGIVQDDLFSATIGRCTRYTFLNGQCNSRKVLVGDVSNHGLTDGPPILGTTHGVGSVFFGADGSLMLSVGDGSLGDQVGPQGVQRGILPQAEQSLIQMRSQSNNSLSGKILRINKDNGNGLADNPNYLSSSPRSAQSRMYVKGLRNPFRATPITQNIFGSVPGKILVSDTGENAWEEIALYSKGDNGGWPHYEGFDTARIGNQFVNFTIDPNAVFKKPLYSWAHPDNANSDKNWGINSKVSILEETVEVNTLQNSYNHTGTSSSANTYYPSNISIDRYQGTLSNKILAGDYTQSKIMGIEFETSNNIPNFSKPNRVYLISGQATQVVQLYTNPYDGYIYVIQYTGGGARVARLILNSNFTPVAQIKSDKAHINQNDKTVQFFGNLSYDYEPGNLSYTWSFGDGSTSNDINPTHTFDVTNTSPLKRNVTLTVTDTNGAFNMTTKEIYINNLAPVIQNISVKTLNNIELNNLTIPSSGLPSQTAVNISVTATDDTTPVSNLIYSIVVNRHHDDHIHPGTPYNTSIVNNFVLLPEGGCGEGATYWYEIIVKVRDGLGAETISSKQIFQVCDGLQAQSIIVNNPPSSLNKNLGTYNLIASSTSGLPVSFRRVELGNSSPIEISINGRITFTGILGKARVVVLQAGNSTYGNAMPKYVDFEVNTSGIVPTVPVADFVYTNICRGQKVNLSNTTTGGEGTTYSWQLLESNYNFVELNNEFNPSFTLPNNVGNGWFKILLTATNSLGTSTKDSGWFNAQSCGSTMPTADFAYDKSEFCNGRNIRLINKTSGGVGTTYLWKLIGPNHEIIATSDSPYALFTLPYNVNSWYKISLTATNYLGSNTKDSDWISSKDCNLNSKIKTNDAKISDLIEDEFIYPNPSNSIINFNDFVIKKFTNYIIYDLSGKEVKKGLITEKDIDISKYENNIYSISFINANTDETSNVKLIKN